MDPDKKILLEHGQYIVYDDCLGSGTFGSVYTGYDKHKELPIAVKRINAAIEFSQNEIDVLMKLKEHDNVVRLLGYFQREGSHWVITQLLRGPTLDAFMEKRNPDIEIKLELAEQLIEALKYIHNSDPAISHRDLKPLNILIVRGHLLKLLDFGLARQMEGTMNAATFAGTINYMAPEIFLFQPYNPFKVDVYAAGLLLLAIATFQVGRKMDHLFAQAFGVAPGQRMLEEGNGDMLMRRIDGLSYPCQQTMELIRLAKTMVTFQPSSRPDMNSVFRTLAGIMRQAPTTDHPSATRETSSTEATLEATSETVTHTPRGSRPERRQDVMSVQTRGGTSDAQGEVLHEPGSSATDGARPKLPSGGKHVTKKERLQDVMCGETQETSAEVLHEAGSSAHAGARPKIPSGGKHVTKKDKGNAGDVSAVAYKLTSTDIQTGVPLSVTQIASHELGHDASWLVGFGFTNDILTGNKKGLVSSVLSQILSNTKFNLSLLHFNGKQYRQLWEKQVPQNMTKGCHKAITRDKEILLHQEYDSPTILYSHQLQQQQKFERSGTLLDCSEKGEVMYSELEPSGYLRIDVYGLSKGKQSDKKPMMTLRPPTGQSRWCEWLSVCRARDRIVVTECDTRSLDIFTSAGKHILHKDLPYTPALYKAVSRCGDGDYVMVGERYPSTAVHVYHTLTGEEAATFSHKQLGLGEDMYIHGLRCCDGVLHIAAGPIGCARTLRAYKVEFGDK